MNSQYSAENGTVEMDYKQLLYSSNFNPGGYAVRAIVLYLRTVLEANKELGFNVYQDELNKTDAYNSVLVTTRYDWETKYRSKRPAIFVSRGNILTGVNSTSGQGRVQSVTENGSITNYQDLISFPIVIECLSESDLECEVLASLVSAFLTMDARPLRSLKMQVFPNPTITAPQIFQKGNVSFIASVMIQVQMARQYSAKLLDEQQLKNFEITVNSSVI